jgi:hypothetical protein
MLHLSHHHHMVVGQLAAAGMNLSAGTTGPWLPFWAQLAAHQNRARLTFLATVAGLLTREGYRARQATEKPDAICPKVLQDLAKAEHEAALDDVNLGRLLTILEELRESSQLIIITHQKRTMEIADALYGVTMRGDGVTEVISQRLRESETA